MMITMTASTLARHRDDTANMYHSGRRTKNTTFTMRVSVVVNKPHS